MEGKEVDLERQRRQVANLTKEASSLKDELRLAKSNSGVKASSNTSALLNRKSAQVSNPGNLRRATTVG